MFWKASARADIKQEGTNYPRLSDKDRDLLCDIKDYRGGYYLVCALTSAAVSIGVACGFNHFATKLIGPRNIAVALALGSGAGSVAINLRKEGFKKRASAIEGLGAKQAEKIFKPLNDSAYSVHDLETVLTDAFALMKFHRNDGEGQPYVVGFDEQASKKLRDFTSQFTYDFGDDSQIKRFVNLLTLSQKLSDECPEKLSALGECGKLIAEPGFVQKLARYVSIAGITKYLSTDSSEQIKLIVDSEYLPCIEEEIYLLCRSALVTLAVMSKNEKLHKTINEDYLGDDRKASSMLRSVICSSATVCNGLASRLEQEIGIDIIGRIWQPLRSFNGRLSNDEVAAISKWSEQNRCRDPLVEAIDRLSTFPVISAINPLEGRAR